MLPLSSTDARTGTVYVRSPRRTLGNYPGKITERLEHWAADAPDREPFLRGAAWMANGNGSAMRRLWLAYGPSRNRCLTGDCLSNAPSPFFPETASNTHCCWLWALCTQGVLSMHRSRPAYFPGRQQFHDTREHLEHISTRPRFCGRCAAIRTRSSRYAARWSRGRHGPD